MSYTKTDKRNCVICEQIGAPSVCGAEFLPLVTLCNGSTAILPPQGIQDCTKKVGKI